MSIQRAAWVQKVMNEAATDFQSGIDAIDVRLWRDGKIVGVVMLTKLEWFGYDDPYELCHAKVTALFPDIDY